VVLGQGTEAAEGYIQASTQLIVSENDDAVSPIQNWSPAPWTSGFSADQFTVLSYNIPDVDGMRAAVDHALTHHAGWVYFTDDGAENPWDSLPSYWAEEIEKIKSFKSDLVNVEDRTTTSLSNITNFRKRRVKVRAQVTNTSTAPLSGTLLLVVESISEPTVSLRNATGETPDGRPFFDLGAYYSGPALDPGEQTSPMEVVFNNPRRRAFTYQTRVYQQSTPPSSKPVVLNQDDPQGYSLGQNQPNPFNPITQISYQISEAGDVTLTIYSALGQQVRHLVQTHQKPGDYRLSWDGKDEHGRNVSSGIYLYRLVIGNFAQTRQMILLK
jgi:hypothetical protein